MRTRLKTPKDCRFENKYLMHCQNVALILAHTENIKYATARIEEYLAITGAELEEEEING